MSAKKATKEKDEAAPPPEAPAIVDPVTDTEPVEAAAADDDLSEDEIEDFMEDAPAAIASGEMTEAEVVEAVAPKKGDAVVYRDGSGNSHDAELINFEVGTGRGTFKVGHETITADFDPSGDVPGTWRPAE